MRKPLSTALVVAALASTSLSAGAASLHVRVGETSTGNAAILADPGDVVTYDVVVELDDSSTGGLAMVVLDLVSAEISLAPLDAPTSAPMAAFVPPLGISENPLGYGGTPSTTGLRQIGGGQNVMNHGLWPCTDDIDCPGTSTCEAAICSPIAGLPVGAVVRDVAQPGSPVAIARGAIAIPEGIEEIVIAPESIRATALVDGGSGNPVWPTEAVDEGTLSPLVITVRQAQAPAVPASTPIGTAVFVIALAALGWWRTRLR